MSQPLFHKTLKFLTHHNVKNQKVIVGVSGGVDSMALLGVLSELSSPCKLSLLAMYVHHGSSPDQKIKSYRNQAKKFVKEVCDSRSIPFISSVPSKKILKTEEEFRNFRRTCLKNLFKKEQAHWIALAHNSGDVLETRLLHLIRGCGAQGLSFPPMDPPWLRPFVSVSREELMNYAKACQIKWLEDPSNEQERFLRNWLRQNWLPALEKQRPGSRDTLARSFSHIAEALNGTEDSFSSLITKKGVKRNALLELSPSRQRSVLAFYMRKQKLKNYGLSHIEELLKHLDRTQKNFTLKLLRKNWRITKDFISVEKS